MTKKPKPLPKFFPTFIDGGHYTPDELADRLLAACRIYPKNPNPQAVEVPLPGEREAEEALKRAVKRLRVPRDRYDETSYDLALHVKEKFNCADSTALRYVAGRRWRTLDNKLKRLGVTLEGYVKRPR